MPGRKSLMFKLQEAFESIQLNAPTRKMENWKYTPVAKLLETEFNIDFIRATAGSPYKRPTQLSQHPFANLALETAAEIKIIEIKERLLSPMQINYSNEKNKAQAVHQRIHVAENIHAEIIFDHFSVDNSACFFNIFTEIVLEKNSKLSIYKKQTLNNISSLIDFILVNQAEGSSFYSFTLDKGAALSRTDIEVHLNQPHAEASVHGFYQTIGSQVADHHSVIHHHAPHCQSSEHYRGILNDSSKAVFNGKIIIDQDAQKTSAQQLNKNILLSSKAEIDTKPELEIYADDVKAKHGATIGQLDEQALFYLLARGIEKTEAITLLMIGFAKEVFLAIPNKKVQESLLELLQ